MEIDGEDEQEHEEDQLPPVHLTLSNIKSLTTLLQAMKISAKQVCAQLSQQRLVWILLLSTCSNLHPAPRLSGS
jgi:cytochrome b